MLWWLVKNNLVDEVKQGEIVYKWNGKYLLKLTGKGVAEDEGLRFLLVLLSE